MSREALRSERRGDTQKSEKNEWIREVENGGFEALGSTSVQ